MLFVAEKMAALDVVQRRLAEKGLGDYCLELHSAKATKVEVLMQKIAQFLGHTSSRVTERTYARYSPSFMRDAAQALDW